MLTKNGANLTVTKQFSGTTGQDPSPVGNNGTGIKSNIPDFKVNRNIGGAGGGGYQWIAYDYLILYRQEI